VEEPVDLERSRLLLVWLQARRAVDRCLSDLLAAGPAGERRVRERLAQVDDLENRAREAFVTYRAAATGDAGQPGHDWAPTSPTAPPRLGLVEPLSDEQTALAKVSARARRGGHGHR
jgi:hypothetical protein